MVSFVTLDQWLSYFKTNTVSTAATDLSRFDPILSHLNLHKVSTPVITIVGTNGKGSTAAYLESLYLNAGYKVGVYTSPHLHEFNERIRINGSPVVDEKIIQAFAALFAVDERACLSMFDYLTLAALFIFAKEELDLIILEAGIGGRLDAVNVVSATGVVVTSIGLDHGALLGDTRDVIAQEKVAVFRSNCWAVSSVKDAPSVIADYARALGVDLHQINKDYQYENVALIDPQGAINNNRPQSSAFTLPNTATQDYFATVSKVGELMSGILPVKSEHVRLAFSSARLPGRFEYWGKPCHCLFDVAHNPEATTYLAARIRQSYPDYRCVAVIGMRTTKDIVESCRPLFSLIKQWYTATLPTRNGATKQQVALALNELGVGGCQSFDSVERAMSAAIQHVQSDDKTLLVVFGSFSTVALAQTYCLTMRD
jgi:dihydrofolate synthase / folylpolyglutamate synthase